MSFDVILPLLAAPATVSLSKSLLDLLLKSKDKNTLSDIKKLTDGIMTKEVLSHDNAIKKIRKFYQTERLVLVVGAGVSSDFGLPNWNSLLQRLIAKTFENQENQDIEKNDIIANLFNMVVGPNALIAARYLALHFKELEKQDINKKLLFEESIRSVLYESLNENKKTKLYDEIIKLCVSPGKNKSLDSVITYNYDDLLEKRLDGLGLEIPYKSIFAVGQNPAPNELPIYHVHGYIPRTGELSAVNRVTLGDDTYHSQYTDIYRWSNLIQLNKFKECNCLFIGNSFTDPNLRRLLDIARDQRGTDDIQHFLIKKKYNADEIKQVISKILEDNKQIMDDKIKANLGLAETAKTLVKTVHKFETNDAHSFGVEVIWVNNYSDIPNILRDIRT